MDPEAAALDDAEDRYIYIYIYIYIHIYIYIYIYISSIISRPLFLKRLPNPFQAILMIL